MSLINPSLEYGYCSITTGPGTVLAAAVACCPVVLLEDGESDSVVYPNRRG